MSAVLLFELEKGPQTRKKIKQYLLNGQEVPQDLADMPQLEIGLEIFLEDYLFLASFSGGECIKLSEVYSYADRVGMREEYLVDLLSFVPELDQVRIKYLAKRAKEEAGQS